MKITTEQFKAFAVVILLMIPYSPLLLLGVLIEIFLKLVMGVAGFVDMLHFKAFIFATRPLAKAVFRLKKENDKRR